MRQRYEHELEKLKTKILVMSNKVTKAIDDITESVIEVDAVKAKAVLEFDDVIDELYVDAESYCIYILAREQPVAGDLRLILSAYSIASDLERCGDLIVNIAKVIMNAKNLLIDQEFKDIYRELGTLCHEIVREAVTSFMNDDLEKAESIERMDDAIDALNKRVAKTLIKNESGKDIDEIVRQILLSRFYERIADHAVNVSRQVKFALTGDMLGNR